MENKTERYYCCFEEPHDGVYMEVEPSNDYNNIEFVMYKDFTVVGSICLRDKDVDRLVEQLQKFRNRNK